MVFRFPRHVLSIMTIMLILEDPITSAYVHQIQAVGINPNELYYSEEHESSYMRHASKKKKALRLQLLAHKIAHTSI